MAKFVGLGMVALAAVLATPASAATVTLDFEGIGDFVDIGDFYNGGAGGALGVQFSPGAAALVDNDVGGTGSFANAPSASSVLIFMNPENAILDYEAGFTNAVSFWYSSSTDAPITIWSDLGGTGTLLGTIDVMAQNTANNCLGDPTGAYCNWDYVSTSFAGTAKSINFASTAGIAIYDNLSLGSDQVTDGAVPEPDTWAMMIGGFGAIGGSLRYRRRKTGVRFA